jgi:beta-galactosidase beta subunit
MKAVKYVLQIQVIHNNNNAICTGNESKFVHKQNYNVSPDRIFTEQVTVAQLVNKLPALYGAQMLCAVFTKAHN